MKRVGIIDIGSNSIKSLLAGLDHNGPRLIDLGTALEETRISTGISRDNPVLSEEAIASGSKAVERLWLNLQQKGPVDDIRIVATSAVRDALNRDAFISEVRHRTGIDLEVLSGEQEAEGIALGVLQDPGIPSDLNRFQLFDQGGGSLEWISFEQRCVRARRSLLLGAVRLTERHIAEPSLPIPTAAREAIANSVREAFADIPLAKGTPVVACGGGVAVLEAITGTPRISRTALESLAAQLCQLSTDQRIDHFKIPPGRADIMPACAIVFTTLLELIDTDHMTHSRYNLRYGLAAKLLF